MTLDPSAARDSQSVVGTGEHNKQVRRAALASAIGTSIEWYDYFLYGTAAALVFPQVFFPNASNYVGQLSSFATIFLGFAARPIGAAIFGHWGDRLGRKAMLIVTLLLMGIPSAIIGILPGAASIGNLAPILLILMRILQGIAIGGEWGGSVLLSVEWGDQKRRGLMGSWPQIGVAVGLILGNGLLLLFSQLSDEAFLSWGWRIPFLLSLVLVATGLYIRMRILETPMFSKVVSSERVSKAPVLEVLRKYPKEIALSALVRMSEQMPFYIVTVFVLTYVADKGFTRNFALTGVLLASCLEFILLPYFGHLSDRVGRKRVYIAGAALTGVWGFLYFAALDSGQEWLVFVGIVLGLLPHTIQYGTQASLIAESFPTHLRYGGAGLGYQLASLVAGGPAAYVAALLVHNFDTGYAVAAYMLFGAVISVIACWLLPDRAKADIDDDRTYGAART
ncbi:MFS transporter [Flindersiella endophytica]